MLGSAPSDCAICECQTKQTNKLTNQQAAHIQMVDSQHPALPSQHGFVVRYTDSQEKNVEHFQKSAFKHYKNYTLLE